MYDSTPDWVDISGAGVGTLWISWVIADSSKYPETDFMSYPR
jgi:hypothetical protein